MSDLELKLDQETKEKFFNKLDAMTQRKAITDALTLGGMQIAAWSQENRLTGPRPTYLGIVSNRLRSSIAVFTSLSAKNSFEVRVGTNVVYAAIHEFGGARGRGMIPARPFLRPSIENRENQRIILNLLTQRISEAVRKA